MKIQLGGRRTKMKGYALIDEDDYEKIANYKWFLTKDGYAVSNIQLPNGKRTIKLMHRIIMGEDNAKQVDHINHIY